MNEEIMNNVTEETANQETIPAETEGTSAGAVLGTCAVLIGTMFTAGFTYMMGCAVGERMFSEESMAKRQARKEARKAKREARKAQKQKKPVIVDEEITIEADTVEE